MQLTSAVKRANVEVEGRPFFINAYLPPPRILAIGAVHITQALANISSCRL